MALISKRTRWQRAFNNPVIMYQELRDAGGGLSAMDLGKLGDSRGNNGGRCSAVVAPTISDFICDVEVNARRALKDDPKLYKHWLKYYQAEGTNCQAESFTILPHEVETDIEVREHVGKMFLKTGIAPLFKYSGAIDIR